MPTDEPVVTKAFSSTTFEPPAGSDWLLGFRWAGIALSVGGPLSLWLLMLGGEQLQQVTLGATCGLALVAWRWGRSVGTTRLKQGERPPASDHVADAWGLLCFGAVLVLLCQLIASVSAALRSGVAPWALALAATAAQLSSFSEWQSAMRLTFADRRWRWKLVTAPWLAGWALLATAMATTGSAAVPIISVILSAMFLSSFWGAANLAISWLLLQGARRKILHLRIKI